MNPGLPGMPTKGFVVSIAAIAERQTLNSFVELVASAGPLALTQIPPIHPGMTACGTLMPLTGRSSEQQMN